MNQDNENQFVRNDQEFEVRNSINKKRGGRPKLDDDSKRTVKIKVGFTKDEFKTLVQKSNELGGIDECELIRILVLNIPTKSLPSVSRDALIQLSRIGNNINQITKLAHLRSDYNAQHDLKKISDELNRIGALIIGGAS